MASGRAMIKRKKREADCCSLHRMRPSHCPVNRNEQRWPHAVCI